MSIEKVAEFEKKPPELSDKFACQAFCNFLTTIFLKEPMA